MVYGVARLACLAGAFLVCWVGAFSAWAPGAPVGAAWASSAMVPMTASPAAAVRATVRLRAVPALVEVLVM